MSEKLEFIVIKDDRIWKSIVSDTYSFGVLTAAVAFGWFIESTTLQIIAGLIWVLFFIGKAMSPMKYRMTISQARKRLDELEEGKGE